MTTISESDYRAHVDFLDSEEEYLEHYGRLGMKWGKHIFGKEKMHKATVKRLTKLDTKYQKKKKKADDLKQKALEKGSKADTSLFFTKSKRKKAMKTSAKAAYRAEKSHKSKIRAYKFAKAMQKEFGNYRLKQLSKEERALVNHWMNMNPDVFTTDMAEVHTLIENIRRFRY